jgi:hypothetical protein
MPEKFYPAMLVVMEEENYASIFGKIPDAMIQTFNFVEFGRGGLVYLLPERFTTEKTFDEAYAWVQSIEARTNS